MDIIVPKGESDTDSRRDKQDRWETVKLPKSGSELEDFDWLTYLEVLGKRVKEMDDQLIDLDRETEKIGELKIDIEKQKSRIPEIIGLFSAIIAIILIDVNIIKSAKTFLAAILLIAALTCSIIVFAWFIHLFFTPEENKKFRKFFWIPIGFLGILIILGCIFHFVFEIDLYRTEAQDNENCSIKIQDNTINLPKTDCKYQKILKFPNTDYPSH